jgi:RNA polymerase sigma factor (sigma-70 family)
MYGDGHTTTGLAGAAARERREESANHAALFEHVLERIYRYFRRLIRDPSEAEECAQRTLADLEATLREGSYDPERSFNTWMWLKAHKAFVAWCRERGKRMEPLSENADGVAAPAVGPSSGDGNARVEERLDAETVLREVERRVGTEAYECFVLRYQGGLTLDEVAETVGRDRKTVTARIQAAHALIARLLEGGPGDDGRGGSGGGRAP